MRALLTAYIGALVLFLAIDMVWISTVVAPLYHATMPEALAEQVRIAPAILFYLVFVAGLVYFAVPPALAQGRERIAALNGGLYGLSTYATYALTNFAVFKSWTLAITASDIVYGALASALVGYSAYRIAIAFDR